MTVTFFGAEKVVEHYNMMGPVKAALESSVRYMAAELGGKGIRVHALSPGAMATRAASGSSRWTRTCAATIAVLASRPDEAAKASSPEVSDGSGDSSEAVVARASGPSRRPASGGAPAGTGPDLGGLLKQASRGDQAAFAELYDATSARAFADGYLRFKADLAREGIDEDAAVIQAQIDEIGCALVLVNVQSPPKLSPDSVTPQPVPAARPATVLVACHATVVHAEGVNGGVVDPAKLKMEDAFRLDAIKATKVLP